MYTCVAKNEEGYSARSDLEVSVMGMYKLFLVIREGLKICFKTQIYAEGSE